LPLPLSVLRREQRASALLIRPIESRGFSPGLSTGNGNQAFFSALFSHKPTPEFSFPKTSAKSHPKAHNIFPFNFNQLQNQLERIVSQESALGFPSLSREPRFSCCQDPRPSKISSTTRKQKRKNFAASGIVVIPHGV
jgi:hypothetical protein